MALRDTLAAAAEDDAVRAVLLTGTGPRVLRRPGPRRARAEPAGRPGRRLGHRPRALHADRDDAGDHAEAGRRRGQRRGRRRRARRSPSPATSGSWPTRPASHGLLRGRAVRRLGLVVDAAAARRHGQGQGAAAAAADDPGRARRWSSAWPPRSSRPTRSPAGPRQLAVRLAAGPTVAYGAIRRSLAFSAGHDIDESLDFERQMMELTGVDRGPSRRRGRLPRQGAADFEGR